MKKFHYLDTIIAPNVTEKSTSLSEFNKIVFKVQKNASKNSIKKSIEKIFKVNVIKINTINLRGTTKIIKNRKTFKSGYKKLKIPRTIIIVKEGVNHNGSMELPKK